MLRFVAPLTALAACIGLLPAALSTGIGSQVRRPLATVVVGGMLIGPVLLLLVVPALRMLVLHDDAAHPHCQAKRPKRETDGNDKGRRTNGSRHSSKSGIVDE